MSKFDERKYNEAKKVGEAFFKKNKTIVSLALGPIKLNSDGFLSRISREF